MTPNRWGLVRYFAAAGLARSADSGAAVGLVLLAVSRRDQLAHPEALGGLLAAALTAPHLLGPVVARRLDLARDSRRQLFAAFVVFAVALAAAAVLLGRTPFVLPLAATLVAGTCGPLLTGGMSSRVADLTGPNQRSRRRGEGLDLLSYGVSSTAGPAGVAALASLFDALTALLALSTAACVAAFVVLTLPATPHDGAHPREAATVRSVLTLLVRNGPLRRVNYATMLTAFSGGGMTIIAVLLATHLTGQPTRGATLVAVLGVGSLIMSLVLTALPLTGEPDRLTTRHVALIGIATALCALAPTYQVALAAFFLVGVANAPFGTATFAARSEYAPQNARAQVFVTMASLKVAAASAGAALAGVLTLLGPRYLPLAAAALVLVAAASTVIDRRLTSRRPPG